MRVTAVTLDNGVDDTVVYYHAAGRASITSGCELSVYRYSFRCVYVERQELTYKHTMKAGCVYCSDD